MNKIKIIALLAVTWFSACKNPLGQSTARIDLKAFLKDSTTKVQNGGVQVVSINTPKGKFNIWTKKIGNNPKIKVLLLNGGPGASHEYFECMESFLPAEGIEFIYYDQLGTGNSDNPKDTAMWSLPRYVDELEQVRQALKLDKNNFYLLGQSWGGILAMEYAIKYQQHIKGLIISNMMSSCPDYGKYANEVLAKQFDPKVLARIRELEAKGDYQNPEYLKLLIPNYYEKHICRFPFTRWPEPFLRSFAKLNESLYVTMQGPSEFGIAGKLAHWNRKADLPGISVPTLTIGAKYDTMDPAHMKWMATQFPNGSFLYCPNGSHLAMYDDQQTYMNGLIKFIKGIDAGEKKVTL
ncbi:proline iminopeptidase-family hydrolase [Mucilaginibacter sp. E4BP6]|uniref:proline iminopeptidase-family hydrolase n=1 Tax=Mucilaginibacter sp. E4BP6 TaxID=2723089 RepID=UPI0017F7E3D7|nr:proline iminopeptidase-family hydrolase [Mucilaginibacter sp. E4BP6]NYE64936.1 proline iminopeptidase [Mucilaginibacter sp. E4BP6]